jgi:hypothetical protein
MPQDYERSETAANYCQCASCCVIRTAIAHGTLQRPEVSSSGWLAVGAEALYLILKGMIGEARQWEAFAFANNLEEKKAYYKGQADALDKLLKVSKELAPTANGPGEPLSPAQ